MSRTFAQIEMTLPHSKKMRQLNHAQKYAYLCAHLSPLGNYIGLFRYPISVWADDAQMGVAELQNAIEQMVDVGLIAFDHEENYLRINAWFLKKNGPDNASKMASYAADFAGLRYTGDMVIGSAAEFAVGSIKSAQRWNADSVEWGKLRAVFKPFLGTMRQNFEDDFHDALSEQLTGQQRAVKAELCALMPSLQLYMEAPCPHPANTVGPHETETRRDGNDTDTKKDENYTKCASANSPPPMPMNLAKVRNAEIGTRKQGPRPETIAAAKRIGAV